MSNHGTAASSHQVAQPSKMMEQASPSHTGKPALDLDKLVTVATYLRLKGSLPGGEGLTEMGAYVEGVYRFTRATIARADSAEQRQRILSTARPLAEWHEDLGDVLWWKFPVEEAPYVGSPHCLGHTVELHTHDTGDGPRVAARTTIGGWPGYHTHWTPLPAVPAEPQQEDGASDV